MITRAAAQADEFARMLTNLGARVVTIPVIEVCPLESEELRRSLREVNDYSWIIFTSSNGAAIFLEKLKAIMRPDELRPRICAIGPGTYRQIEQMGFPVAMIPNTYQAEGILEEFSRLSSGLADKLSILIPRALRAREVLPEVLKEMGMNVNVVPVYKTLFPAGSIPELRVLLDSASPDMITFTSSSTVLNFMKLAGNTFDLHSCRYASIGPVTSETALKAGLRISVNARESTLESLAEAIADYYLTIPTGAANPPISE